MKIIHSQENRYILKLDRGEELVAKLKEFCQHEKIFAGFFVGLGASSVLTLAFYNIETQKYEEKEFNHMMEIAGLTGNVSCLGDDLVIHAHGSFAGEDFMSVAGHVMKLVVGGACEIAFDKFDGKIEREKDTETGLNLLKPSH